MLSATCRFLLLALCFLSSGAFAADYKVSYAIDAGDVTDSGTLACDDKSTCKIKLERLQLSFKLEFKDPRNRGRVTIRILGEGDRSGCCYFSDGVDEVNRDVMDSPLRLYLYAGRPRNRNEFIINEPLGILHLQFVDLK